MPRDGSSYFEKVCLRGEIAECRDRAWAFERVPDRMIQASKINDDSSPKSLFVYLMLMSVLVCSCSNGSKPFPLSSHLQTDALF